MKYLEQMAGEKVPEYLSTHPSNEKRIQKITEWLPEAEETRLNSDCNQVRTIN